MSRFREEDIVKYEVTKDVTVGNYIPQGARLASRSKEFKKGQIIEGTIQTKSDKNVKGFETLDGFWFPFDPSGENSSRVIKPVSKTKETLTKMKEFFKSPEFADDDETIEGTISNLEKTRLVHYGMYAGAAGIGALIGAGTASVMEKTGYQKGLIIAGGALLVAIPTAIWLVPKTKQVNTKLKTVKSI